MTDTAATPDLEPLEAFVGTWTTEGEVTTAAPGRRTAFTATDTYEWLPGGHFLLHRFDADMPDGRVEGIEVIGQGRASGTYAMHAFDNTGTSSVMQARIEGGRWTFVGENIRFAGRFGEGGRVFAGSWEGRSGRDGSWQPLMEVTLTRTDRSVPRRPP